MAFSNGLQKHKDTWQLVKQSMMMVLVFKKRMVAADLAHSGEKWFPTCVFWNLYLVVFKNIFHLSIFRRLCTNKSLLLLFLVIRHFILNPIFEDFTKLNFYFSPLCLRSTKAPFVKQLIAQLRTVRTAITTIFSERLLNSTFTFCQCHYTTTLWKDHNIY